VELPAPWYRRSNPARPGHPHPRGAPMTPPNDDHDDQVRRAKVFRELHHGETPLRLVNACDAFSARTFALAGAPAVATSSFAVAMSHGYDDGQHLPWPTVVATIAEIAGA